MIKEWLQKVIVKNKSIENVFKYHNIFKNNDFKQVKCYTVKDDRNIAPNKIIIDKEKQEKVKLNEFQILNISQFIAESYVNYYYGEIYLSEEQKRHYEKLQETISNCEKTFERESLEFVIKDIEKSVGSRKWN
jgi:hypothetical protein